MLVLVLVLVSSPHILLVIHVPASSAPRLHYHGPDRFKAETVVIFRCLSNNLSFHWGQIALPAFSPTSAIAWLSGPVLPSDMRLFTTVILPSFAGSPTPASKT